MPEQTPPPSGAHAYAAAGVDIEAADKAVTLMHVWVEKTSTPRGDRLARRLRRALRRLARSTRYTQPILATSTDGVGTKVAIAQAMDIHDTIGFDLVGMVVDDLVVCGAEPLFMTDYIACGRVVPERIAAIVKGIAEACVEAGCSLIGGETAEHPGLMEPDEYDVAGATHRVWSRPPTCSVRAGSDPATSPLAMASSGLHSNGYSLVRHVLLEQAGWALDRHVDELGRTLGEELLEPTRIYTKACLALAAETSVHAMAHITGGGLAGNLARVMPEELSATLDRGTWVPAPIFDVVRRVGAVSQDDLESTLNCGVGMVALLPAAEVDRAVATLDRFGVHAWVAGEVRLDEVGGGEVRLTGQYAGWGV